MYSVRTVLYIMLGTEVNHTHFQEGIASTDGAPKLGLLLASSPHAVYARSSMSASTPAAVAPAPAPAPRRTSGLSAYHLESSE